jgi:hypothetical protein
MEVINTVPSLPELANSNKSGAHYPGSGQVHEDRLYTIA